MSSRATRSCDALPTDSWAISAQAGPSWIRRQGRRRPASQLGRWRHLRLLPPERTLRAYAYELVAAEELTPPTISSYIRALEEFVSFIDDCRGPEWQWFELDHSAAYGFMRWLERKRLSAGAIARRVAALRRFYSDVLASSRLPRTPRESAHLPVCLPESIVRDVLDVAAWRAELHRGWIAQRDLAILELTYSSAPRLDEIARLDRRDLTLYARDELLAGNAGAVRLDAGGPTERCVRIGSYALRAILDYLEARPDRVGRGFEVDPEPLFVSSTNGRRLRKRQIERICSKAMQQIIGEPGLSVRVLRTSAIVHMLDHGADLVAVQELAGCRSLQHMTRYKRLATRRLRTVYNRAHPRAMLSH